MGLSIYKVARPPGVAKLHEVESFLCLAEGELTARYLGPYGTLVDPTHCRYSSFWPVDPKELTVTCLGAAREGEIPRVLSHEMTAAFKAKYTGR